MQNRKIERLSYGLSWPHRKTACIRESRAGRRRERGREDGLDRWMESVGGKIGRSVNRGGRAATSKEAGTIRGGPSWRFRGASVSPLDRDVTRAKRFICHCRSSFRATCHEFVRLVPRFPAPIPGNIFAQRPERTYFLADRIGSKRYREYFREKCEWIETERGGFLYTKNEGEGGRVSVRDAKRDRLSTLEGSRLSIVACHDSSTTESYQPSLRLSTRLSEAPTNASEACNSRDEAARSRHSGTKMSARIQG